MTSQPMKATQWLLLFVLSVLWGGSFFFNKILLQELSPLTIVLGRVSCGAIGLLLLGYLRGQKMPTSLQMWRSFLMMGVLNNLVPFSLIVWGQQSINSGLAAILNATTPLFTVLLAHFLTQEERLTSNRLTGVLLGLVGVVVLMGTAAFQGFSPQNAGQIAVLGAAFSYALAGLYGRRFKAISPLIAAAGMLVCTAIVLLPVALWVEQPWTLEPGIKTWGAMLGLGLFSTAAAYLIYFALLASAGATNLMLVTFLIPISALLLGTFVLHEPVTRSNVAGMLLIFMGLAVIDGRLWKRFF